MTNCLTIDVWVGLETDLRPFGEPSGGDAMAHEQITVHARDGNCTTQVLTAKDGKGGPAILF